MILPATSVDCVTWFYSKKTALDLPPWSYQCQPTRGMLQQLKAITLMLSWGRCDFALQTERLLSTLTQTECTRPDTLGPPQDWVPVQLTAFVHKGVFVKQRGCWLSLSGHVETLTVHVHGHCGLHRPEKDGVAGVTCQLPPVVRAQGDDPLRGNRKKWEKDILYWGIKSTNAQNIRALLCQTVVEKVLLLLTSG